MLSTCWGIPDVTQWFWWLHLRGWCYLSVPVSYADFICIPYFSSVPRGGNILCRHLKIPYPNQIRTRYRNWRTTSTTKLQPSKSLCYIGYTATWLDACSCVLMQEPTTFTIFYDGISFQHLAAVLISVFTLWYEPGLLSCGPSCISTETFAQLWRCVLIQMK